MLKRILTAALLLSCAIARADSTTTGAARVIENPTTNGTMAFRVSPGGVKTDAIVITGSTGNVLMQKGLTESVTANGGTGALNDVAWTTGVIKFNGTVTSISGVVAQPEGTKLTLYNDQATTINIVLNGGSTVTNRFVESGSGASYLTLRTGQSINFTYLSGRWRSELGYEEGTFTPTFESCSGTQFTTTTYVIQQGHFTRTGRLLCYSFYVNWSNTTGSATGAACIGGLPYAARNVTNSYGAGAVSAHNIVMPASTTWIALQSEANSNELRITAQGPGIAEADVVTNSNGGAVNRYFVGGGCYQMN